MDRNKIGTLISRKIKKNGGRMGKYLIQVDYDKCIPDQETNCSLARVLRTFEKHHIPVDVKDKDEKQGSMVIVIEDDLCPQIEELLPKMVEAVKMTWKRLPEQEEATGTPKPAGLEEQEEEQEPPEDSEGQVTVDQEGVTETEETGGKKPAITEKETKQALQDSLSEWVRIIITRPSTSKSFEIRAKILMNIWARLKKRFPDLEANREVKGTPCLFVCIGCPNTEFYNQICIELNNIVVYFTGRYVIDWKKIGRLD